MEAEQSLLGGILLDNTALDRVADIVGADDFYRDGHRRIYRHIVRLVEAGKPADLVTVSEAIGTADENDKTGGAPYLAGLAQNTPSALNIRAYAELVRDKSLLRRLAQVGTEIAEKALAPIQQDVSKLLDESESRIFQIGDQKAHSGEGLVGIQPVLARVIERIDHLYHQGNPSDVTGVPTGFIDLDRKMSGLQPGELIIVAGRPSMGKTSLALNFAECAALENGLPVAIFSLEMTAAQLGTRLLGSIARVSTQKMRNGRLSDQEWADLSDAMGKLHDLPIYIDDAGSLTAMQVRARARRMKRQHSKLGLVVIDYLQLMESSSEGENRATEVSEITRSLKAMAKELDCPVVALSQLNRKVDERLDKRPVMSDLRESGAIEQDADAILFIYREAVYKPDLPAEQQTKAEVIIGKQRNGPIGTVYLTYLGQYTRFENCSFADM